MKHHIVFTTNQLVTALFRVVTLIRFFIILALICFHQKAYTQCFASFSSITDSNQVMFTNESTIQNSHFYWSFGDGTGSNFVHPIHVFPASGKYKTILYVHDTISDCYTYFEKWTKITLPMFDSCNIEIFDSFYYVGNNKFLKIFDTRFKCDSFEYNTDGGFFFNFTAGMNILMGNTLAVTPFEMLIRNQYIDPNYIRQEEVYKTCFSNFSHPKIETSCSAIFETRIARVDTNGLWVEFVPLLSNLNKTEWRIYGFGNPIITNASTYVKFYPYTYNDIWSVGMKSEHNNGCVDSFYQSILVSKKTKTTDGLLVDSTNEQFYIFPNPVQSGNILHITSKNQILSLITLFDITGKQITSLEPKRFANDEYQVNLPLVATGNYIIKLTTLNTNISKRICIISN